MKFRYSLFLFLFSVLLYSCVDDEWDTHYSSTSETINVKMWDAIRDTVTFPQYAKYSKFVDYMVQAGYDTVLNKNQSFTLLIPDNKSFDNFLQVGNDLYQTLGYHISKTVFLPANIDGARKLETLSNKFVILSKNSEGIFVDGIHVKEQSPLFTDGIFLELESIAYPRPSLYEYFAKYSKTMAWFINQKDSLAFDVVNSTTIGFDEQGRTLYDSVFTKINNFEEKYFPVTQEYRSKAATFLMFTQEQYEGALNQMSNTLGAGFNDYRDIPIDWQEDVLIPYFLETSVFDSAITYSKLSHDTLKNIWGDSVVIDHFNVDPSSKYECSNGVVYSYNSFEVPEFLYVDTIRIEGESLLQSKGTARYEFIDGVTANTNAEPSILTAAEASGEEYLNVLLSPMKNFFAGEYYIDFVVPQIFPGNYTLRWRANNKTAGVISIWVNGTKLGSIDNFDFKNTIDGVKSIGRSWNYKDFQLTGTNRIATYGNVNIRVMYEDKSRYAIQGVCIDYIELIPITDK